ncbi:MAG: tetratricopeptide repeat protein, partial [Nitrososphaerota archaeon]
SLLDKGRVFSEQGKYAEAISYCDKVLKIDPDNTDALKCKKIVLEKRGTK